MTKKYTLTTSEETVTENPEDIIRLMKLAGLTNAQPVAEEEVTEEVEAEVYEPTEANDELDLDDFSKKSPESISKQKKSIQPTLGDNPLEYSLDENEIYEAMMKEFKELEESHGYLSDCCGAPADDDMDENNQAMCSNCKDYSSFSPVEESIKEAQSPAQKAAFAKMLAAKDGKKDEAVEETEEVIEESKPDFLDLDKDGDKEESMKKAAKDKKEKADESVEEVVETEEVEAVTIQDAVNESQERLKYLIGR